MISTIHGLMDEALLEKRLGTEEDQDQKLTWIEYWLNNELVHRSIDLYLKRGIDFSLQSSNLV